MKITGRHQTLPVALPATRPRGLPGYRPGRRGTRWSSLAGLFLTAAALTGLSTACDTDVRDHMCMSNEYPVAAVGSSLGGACVTNGQQPPAGYVRYPKGQVPLHVDDTWDTYWQSHTLDAHGHPAMN
ncbi:SCO0607 family lipoprotein [Streptomyces polygonati]|uniref:SCO0607 family lipoprotein n=1 Tax=Streptomyces polygonati TaxID=1617087 RepID=A0ABV8HW45_9ACTN